MQTIWTLELAEINGTEPSFMLLITLFGASQNVCFEKGLWTHEHLLFCDIQLHVM